MEERSRERGDVRTGPCGQGRGGDEERRIALGSSRRGETRETQGERMSFSGMGGTHDVSAVYCVSQRVFVPFPSVFFYVSFGAC